MSACLAVALRDFWRTTARLCSLFGCRMYPVVAGWDVAGRFLGTDPTGKLLTFDRPSVRSGARI